MPVRTGKEYIAGLRDDRRVYVNGDEVRDVTSYEPFQGAINTLAGLYDLQSDPRYAPAMTYESPSDGAPVSTSFLMATTWDEVQQRVRGEGVRTDQTYGLMGRLPDYMNAFLADTAAIPHLLGRNDPVFAERTQKYYEFVRDRDLALTHTLVDPQIDRSKGVEAQDAMHVVEETSEGVVVEGAKLLSTLAPISDEIYVGPYLPRKPGQEPYTLLCSVPCNIEGLKFICREGYDRGRSSFDRPLTSRYDEGDALAIFDRVLVPWDRVFAYGDVDTYNLIAPAFPGYLLLQAVIRGAAKLKFMIGVASMMADANGRSENPRYQEMIGELVLQHEIAEGLIAAVAQEVVFNANNPFNPGAGPDEDSGEGAFIPGVGMLFGAPGRTALGITAIRIFFPYVHTKAVDVLRMVGSSSLIMTPTEADFANEDIAETLNRYLRGRGGLEAKDRVRLFKLAWDLIGEEFGSRSMLYEWFFAGDPINNRLLGYNMPRRLAAHGMAQRLFDELKEAAGDAKALVQPAA
jgi:4-hydroxyphenylacetate 3-monooxygenase oxygenase component